MRLRIILAAVLGTAFALAKGEVDKIFTESTVSRHIHGPRRSLRDRDLPVSPTSSKITTQKALKLLNSTATTERRAQNGTDVDQFNAESQLPASGNQTTLRPSSITSSGANENSGLSSGATLGILGGCLAFFMCAITAIYVSLRKKLHSMADESEVENHNTGHRPNLPNFPSPSTKSVRLSSSYGIARLASDVPGSWRGGSFSALSPSYERAHSLHSMRAYGGAYMEDSPVGRQTSNENRLSDPNLHGARAFHGVVGSVNDGRNRPEYPNDFYQRPGSFIHRGSEYRPRPLSTTFQHKTEMHIHDFQRPSERRGSNLSFQGATSSIPRISSAPVALNTLADMADAGAYHRISLTPTHGRSSIIPRGSRDDSMRGLYDF